MLSLKLMQRDAPVRRSRGAPAFNRQHPSVEVCGRHSRLRLPLHRGELSRRSPVPRNDRTISTTLGRQLLSPGGSRARSNTHRDRRLQCRKCQLSRRRGHIIGSATKRGVKLIEVSAILSGGISGGPIVNDRYQVIVIAHRGGNQEHKQLAVEISELLKLAKE